MEGTVHASWQPVLVYAVASTAVPSYAVVIHVVKKTVASWGKNQHSYIVHVKLACSSFHFINNTISQV